MRKYWGDEAKELVRRLVTEGLPYSFIAEQLSEHTGRPATRCVIAGMVMRMGISRPKWKWENKPQRAPKPSTRRINMAPPPQPELDHESPPQPQPGGVGLVNLGHRSCRWPLWGRDDPDRRYCGARTDEGSSYCAHHRVMAYQAPRVSRSSYRKRRRL